MDVYLDAVLHPNCINDPRTFAQEGWHYEVEDLKVGPSPCLAVAQSHQARDHMNAAAQLQLESLSASELLKHAACLHSIVTQTASDLLVLCAPPQHLAVHGVHCSELSSFDRTPDSST